MKWTDLIFLAAQFAAIVDQLEDDEDAEIPYSFTIKSGRKKYVIAGTVTEVSRKPRPEPES